jgi:hypothetical protein
MTCHENWSAPLARQVVAEGTVAARTYGRRSRFERIARYLTNRAPIAEAIVSAMPAVTMTAMMKNGSR